MYGTSSLFSLDRSTFILYEKPAASNKILQLSKITRYRFAFIGMSYFKMIFHSYVRVLGEGMSGLSNLSSSGIPDRAER